MIGPKILGNATNIIFEGVIGKQLPAGVTQDQVVAALRAAGDEGQANLIAGMNVVPGQGIDFDQLAQVLLLVLVLYVVASLAMWAQAFILNGVVQRTVLRLRARRRGQAPPPAAQLLRHACRAASCSAASRTTSTTSRRRCSRR